LGIAAKKQIMKKLGIYDPYLHILGGAERYIFSIVKCLSDYQIILFNGNQKIVEKAENKFGIKLNSIEYVPWNQIRDQRNNDLSKLDLFLYVTDGSIFLSPAKQNILLIQSPVHIPKNNLINNLKFFSWKKIICYSQFMADIIRKKIHKQAAVLFVPVEISKQLPKNKKNQILTVGRFFPHLHNKKQLEMVEFFKQMINDGLENTKLFIIGSIDPGGQNYFDEVKRAAVGFPISIVTNATYYQLSEIYSESKIYWHAAGFNEDLEKYPEKAEHFGVSTIEAMARGCVPVVFAGGGQLEIIKHKENGYLWTQSNDLQFITKNLLEDDQLLAYISLSAFQSVQNYSLNKFGHKLKEIIG
jgi:glycosyltransferase involved in cell wall biosynthesis